MVPLTVAESSALSNGVTVVGMRFYPTSIESLQRAALIQEPEAKLLFLVGEVDNEYDINAVMLHDGKNKIASVCSEDARSVRAMLQQWRDKTGVDNVIVCSFNKYAAAHEMKNYMSIKLKCHYRVDERLARKFAGEEHKKGKM